jgi:hypothetical protein
VSEGTVRNDRKSGAQDYAPGPITGLDGKTYKPPTPDQLSVIRDWARENGWPLLSERSQIPAEYLEEALEEPEVSIEADPPHPAPGDAPLPPTASTKHFKAALRLLEYDAPTTAKAIRCGLFCDPYVHSDDLDDLIGWLTVVRDMLRWRDRKEPGAVIRALYAQVAKKV